ncbi:MAG: transglycosylase SLT domain-containing protein [Rhodocyclaceae bacterium]|nr:transglycosylase SLT domain-containing protein [Rhodocyclaceae bacterium]MBX3668326.1 transglycosylase SLT domain-containing protein [Rhodocyclaceae bacterium]
MQHDFSINGSRNTRWGAVGAAAAQLRRVRATAALGVLFLLAACQSPGPTSVDATLARTSAITATATQGAADLPPDTTSRAEAGAALRGPGIDPLLLAEPSLWGRLRRGFNLPALDDERAERFAQQFARSDFFGRRAERVRMYLPLIAGELEARAMPLELALLPLVESSLNPQARSPVGATGTWQFMAPTARRFDLRTSHLVDDRKNVLASTRAALDYLQTLYGQFGDWHLAMAAYNWGEGSVQKAVDRRRAQGGTADFVDLAALMPAETRNYVPQIDALSRLVANPAAYGIDLPDAAEQTELVSMPLAQDMDFALLAGMTGLSEKRLQALNPTLRKPLVLAAATPVLLLPQDSAARLKQRLASHKGPSTSWSVVKLNATAPVADIAAAHGVSATVVRDVNNIPAGKKPVAGSVLLLPVAAPAGTRAAEALVARASFDLAPDLVLVRTRARKGETLAALARRTHVDASQLAAWNELSGPRARRPLRPGQTLALWVVRERAGEFPALAAADPGRAKVTRTTARTTTVARNTRARGAARPAASKARAQQIAHR